MIDHDGLILDKGDVLSCHWQGNVDSCCSPKYGLVVLALQWVPGYGPADEFTIHGMSKAIRNSLFSRSELGLWPDTW